MSRFKRTAPKARSTRRGFIKHSCLLGAGALGAFAAPDLLGTLARAAGPTPDAASTDRYFIFCYFSGGWDVLLSLDPRHPAEYNESNLAEFRIQPGWQFLDNPNVEMVDVGNGVQFGPFIGDLGRIHGDKLCVVRGMSMETLTHEVGRRRFLTGKPPSGLLARGSSAATWLAYSLGAEQPVPNLAVGVETYNSELPTYASGLRVLGVNDLVDTLAASDFDLSPQQNAALDAVLRQYSQCDSFRASPLLVAAEEGRRKAQEMVGGGFDALFGFKANTPDMVALRSHYGFNTSNSATTGVLSPAGQAALAVTAITSGLSRVVSITAASGLDTHYDNWTDDQGPRQEAGFNAIARMMEDLAGREFPDGSGDSWLDHTTIVGFSEFSRTPMLNANVGRDHALMNACFLAGAGIQPGIIGASSNVGMAPQLVDPVTGLVSQDGEIIKPEHVIRALMEDIGVTDDIVDLRVDPLRAALIKG